MLDRVHRFNQARPWSHNNHYHRWILRRLPTSIESALDVGCGSGDLVRLLATRARSVVGVDRDATIIGHAPRLPNVRYVTGDALAMPDARYQVITSVAALHHLPLDQALATFRRRLTPGGTLIVIGLYAPATITDRLLEALAIPTNMLISAAHGKSSPTVAMSAPVRAPATTMAEIREQAQRHLPGARIRRHLFWRYSLVFRA
ncbi:MAG TPA: class I SAM-dependent methyltransferase [Pseudonocardiaceae bacterium]|nr:class I SAM-dependent methyltransferase [Pseudonocardiaceae bacterium]